MKMSFFWAMMIGLSVINICTAIFKNEYDLWFYFDIVCIIASIYYYLAYRKSEKREAEAKKQFFNIFIQNSSGLSEEEVARAARKVIDESGSKF